MSQRRSKVLLRMTSVTLQIKEIEDSVRFGYDPWRGLCMKIFGSSVAIGVRQRCTTGEY